MAKNKVTIAFLGTDGSGKSTIINAVIPILNEAFHSGVHYEHMRPNYMPSLAVAMGKKRKVEPVTVCTDPHAGKPSGFLGSLLRLNYYMIDYTYGYFRKIYLDKSVKTHVWIFDRYYYDYLIDPQRGRIQLPEWMIRFYGLFVPTPDIIICLGTDAKKIHERKPELPLEEVERQVNKLQNFARKHKKAVWIDTGCSIEESTKQTMDAILSIMTKRFKNISLQ